jgi:hypothetical protein
MALQMTDRLDNLYVAAIDRDASLMHANAVSACARWCSPKTTHAQVQEFVHRQIASLEGLNDSLSNEIRMSWNWLAAELGEVAVGATATAPATAPSRLLKFGRRTERAEAVAHAGGRLRSSAAA